MVRVLLALFFFILLISCKDNSLLCEVYIICDPNKEGECERVYEEAQKACESKKNN